MCDLVPKIPLAKRVVFALALGVAGGFSPSVAHAGSGVQPANGATTSEAPTFLVSLDQYDSLASVHVSTSTEMTSTGSPVVDVGSCSPTTPLPEPNAYTCAPSTYSSTSSSKLAPGTYYWWVSFLRNDPAEGSSGTRVSGPFQFTVAAPTTPSGGSGGVAPTRTRAAAPNLPTVQRWRGTSAKQGRLSAAVYQYSKWLGYPRRVAVACWSDRDWPTVSESAEHHNLLGFWAPLQPRWLHLAPQTCRAMETLLTSRPQYPNVITANALDTVAHEMIHAMGIRTEPLTECFAMQTADVLGWYLGIRGQYLKGLSRLFLAAYKLLPARYRDPVRCREGGAWDLEPKIPSSPWHP